MDLVGQARCQVMVAVCVRQDLDIPLRSVHADPLPIPDPPRGMLHRRHGGKPYSRAITAPWASVPHLRHQSLDRDEQRRPTGVRLGCDQDVAPARDWHPPRLG